MSEELLFYEFIRVSVGVNTQLSRVPTSQEWKALFLMAQKHTLLGICFAGMKRLPQSQVVNLSAEQKMQWLAMATRIQRQNDLMNQRCLELQELLTGHNVRCCILKGQGVAAFYPKALSSFRQPGDIDVWVEGGLETVKTLASNMQQSLKVTEQHSDLEFFSDVEVEVHFIPTMLRNPFSNRYLQRWIKKNEADQFTNRNEAGFCVPTSSFNFVYLMNHIFRHIFGEGVGLRQVMDYYMLLCSHPLDENVKAETMDCLHSLQVGGFAAGLMWVMKEVFGLANEQMLCAPNKKQGTFILNEIIQAGNMGQYDRRLVQMRQSSKWKRFLLINLHTFRLFKYYPQESFFSPFARMWIWVWRKWHGWM